METQNLYTELLNLRGVEVSAVDIQEEEITFSCHSQNSEQTCPNCGHKTTTIHQYTKRKIRDLALLNRKVFLIFKVKQFHCKNCNKFFNERLGFIKPNHDFTLRQEQYMFLLASRQAYTTVAALMDTSPKTVERLYLANVDEQVQNKARFEGVKRIGIDEQSHRKGKRNYIGVITDLDSGIVLELLPDRRKETLIAFFEGLGEVFCQNIIAVSCDIWKPFISVIEQCFPNAVVVLDYFHVVKHLNDSLDKYRKSLRKQHPNEPCFKCLKWLLFKRWSVLNEEEQGTLNKAFALDKTLEKLYWHRQQFYKIMESSADKTGISNALNEWVSLAQRQGLVALDSFCKLLNRWKAYIINYALTGLSNATTEGLNNLIRFMRRISFGIPNFKHLRLRVLALDFI
jgi:transposase